MVPVIPASDKGYEDMMKMRYVFHKIYLKGEKNPTQTFISLSVTRYL